MHDAPPSTPVDLWLSTPLQPSSDAERVGDLARRFDEALAAPTADSMRALHDAAQQLAAAMRSAGLAPERALVTMKTLLRGHGRQGWSPSCIGDTNGELSAETRLYQALFGWWVDAYFGETR